ncbi:MAG: glycosyltransferase family 39 protein [Bacteroidota bacterium]
MGHCSSYWLRYVYALFIPLMDYDSAHHAGIALHMYLTNNYAFLVDNGKPYLDKPHLLFWLAALSYKIFGVTSFAYKFPSFLFSLLAIYSTYRLCKQLYNKPTGVLAAIILATAFAFTVSVNDVRMEGLLTGSVIFSVWQLYDYVKRRKAINLIFAALGMAAGFSTKGMIGVAIPVIALLLHLLYTKQWRMIFHPAWIILVILFALFISPVVYAYYLQFDLHPETVVREQNNISGVKFILWNQNLQRMKGESHGANQSDFFFFFHTFIWAFLPWSLLCILAVAARGKELFKTKFHANGLPEIISIGTSVFFIIIFSFSRFKLPHYLNCLFPFFSILLAGYLVKKRADIKKQKQFWILQVIVVSLMLVLGLILSGWTFPFNHVWKAAAAFCLLAIVIAVFFYKTSLFNKQILLTVSGFVFLLGTLTINFYPQLLTWQAGNQLAFKAVEQKIEPSGIYYFIDNFHSPSFDFYSGWLHSHITAKQINDSITAGKSLWIYTNKEGYDTLRQNGNRFGRVYSNKDYRVSVLKGSFINPKTRDKAVTTTYLIELL